MKHAYPRLIAWTVVVALAASASSCRGVQIRKLEDRVAKLETQVAVLESQVASRSQK